MQSDRSFIFIKNANIFLKKLKTLHLGYNWLNSILYYYVEPAEGFVYVCVCDA